MAKYRRGSGSIYKRGKTYWLHYYVDGNSVSESARTSDRAEARRILQAKIGQVAEGRYTGPAAERVTFEDLVQGLLNDYRANAKKTLKWAERRIRLHLAPFFGGRKAHEITSADVQAFIAKRQEQGASNGEINRETTLLKRMYNLALQVEKITRRPPHISRLDEDNVRQGFFERPEFEAVLARLPDYLKPPIRFAYQVGWRILSEILALTWQQVDLEAGTVRLEVGTTKNKKGRLVYLPAPLGNVLESQWQEHVARFPDCPWVFHNQGARIFSFYKAWHRACREAGLSGKIPHDFRRTAVRNMVRAGIPERVAMEIAGHKTRAIFDRYHIVSDSDLKEAARKIGEAYSAQIATNLATIASKS